MTSSTGKCVGIRSVVVLLCAIIECFANPMAANGQCVGWQALNLEQLSNPGVSVRAMASVGEGDARVIYIAAVDNYGASMLLRSEGEQYALFTTFRGAVQSMLVFDDGSGPALYVAGQMYERSGSGPQQWLPATNMMKYAGSTWSSVGTLQGVSSLAIAKRDGVDRLFACGTFVRTGGAPGDRVAWWDGSRWQALVDEPVPTGRTFHAMAYDPIRQRVVMFGGMNTDRQVLGDTWEWNGVRWYSRGVSGPAARKGHVMFYDSSRQKVMLFGGAPSSAYQTPGLADMWEWDGVQWAELPQSGGPGPRIYPGVAFDSTRSVLVLNGGEPQTEFIATRDTWEWSSATNTWTQRSSIGPFATLAQGMAFDPSSGRTRMFGGMERGSRTQKLWEWNPTTGLWALLTNFGPAARAGACFFHDPIQGGFVLYGGGGLLGSEDGIPQYSDVWRLSGTVWTQAQAAAPCGARAGAAMVYDAALGRHVLFGGTITVLPGSMRDTWTYDGATWTNMGIGEPDGPVRAMCVHDDGTGAALYIAGAFNRCGPLSTRGIAKWTGSAWQALGDQVTWNGDAYFALISHTDAAGPALYWAADISDLAGAVRYKTVRWRGGTWTDMSAGLVTIPQVFGSLTLDGQPTLMCGALGGFDTQGNPIGGLRWNGASWEPAFSGVRGYIYSFLAPDGPTGSYLYAGGEFRYAAGRPATNLARLGVVCEPVIITRHPQDVVATGSDPVGFSVQATGTGPLTYQWRRDSVPINDTVGRNHIIGSGTAFLSLRAWSLNDVGIYDCVVSGPAGTEVSQSATLAVPGTSPPGFVHVESISVLPSPAPGYPAGNSWIQFFYPGANVSSGGRATISGYSHGPDIGERFIATMATGGAAPFEIIADATDYGPAPLGYTYRAFNPNSKAVANSEYIVTGGLNTLDITRPAEAILRVDASGAFSVIAATGMPSGAPGETFGRVFDNYAAIGEGGHAAFKAGIRGIEPYEVPGLFFWAQGGGLLRVARVGEMLPGSTIPVTSFSTTPLVTPGGRMWFIADGGTNTPVTRLYYSDGSGPQESIGIGDPLPGGENGEVVLAVSSPLLASGEACLTEIAFDDGTGSTGQALVSVSDDGAEVLVRTGDSATGAPEPGSKFATLEALASTAGMIVFRANVVAPCQQCSTTSVWLRDEQGVRLISWGAVRPAGWHPTNAPVNMWHARINARGEVLLSDQDNVSVFGWTRDAGLFTIAGRGTQFEVAPGQFRTIVEASLPTITPDANCIDDQGNALLTPTMLAGEAALSEIRFNDFLTAFRPCPSITRDPVRTFSLAFDQAVLQVAAGGETGFSYRWRHSGQPLNDGTAPEGEISGAGTDRLVISGIRSAAAGEYDVVVSNACGTVTSAQATLQVKCYADFNEDGGIDGEDVSVFFARWEAGEPSADVSGDGGIDGADVEFFFAVWEGGGC